MKRIASAVSLIAWFCAAWPSGGPIHSEEPGQRSESGPLAILKASRGKELNKLEAAQASELLDAMAKLIPGRHYSKGTFVCLWRVWDWKEKEGPPLYVLCEAADWRRRPGSTDIRLTALAASGKVVSETSFGTAWRCYLHDVKLETLPGAKVSVACLETSRGKSPGQNYRKQYYGRIGNRFDLVRVTDETGKATRNIYHIKHFACGPKLPQQTDVQWEADLLSADYVRLLRALVWLGGRHSYSGPGWGDKSQYEDPQDVSLVGRVRDRELIKSRLRELAKSENAWLREAAQLALNPDDMRE